MKAAENAARSEMLPIPGEHLVWLQRIARTHDICLEKDSERFAALAHFLDNWLVLHYRNGSDWYDVHPLLRELVDGHDARTGA
ncbi:MAG: hypothetical protein IPJ27_12035 [Candidatus Accumulibacter sp.]|uniref:Uncharacterized protein n=1 Tax=Candidatus Accumulibacter proximus TaxID=2954385 RepID=A0A935Q1R8_9PROT|nr:hypothetical protein [Candidatus Accumulibacter proximus]